MASSAADQRQAATDQGKVTRGNKNTNVEAGGLAVTQGSSLQTGGIATTSSGSGTVNTYIGDTTGESAKQLGEAMRAQAASAAAQAAAAAKAQETQTLGNTDIFKTLLASQTAQTGNILATLATQSAGSTSALSSLSRDALGQVSGLAASQQTGGVSMLNKTVLYIGLGVLVVVGLFIFAKK